MAGSFKQRMGEMFADERAVQQNPDMSAKEKQDIIKRIKEAENTEAKAFYAAGERTTPQ
jgi:ribosomal protein S30